ncbi:signal peptide peptidase-domain-containing protein [Phascolomyces articulosus]|uniref:Signal peptide peptidase-domain-containing protein n=1 Tax=Phascolomyces articulosus TaxID=60185 RepID=A0AAD5JRI3_9FUNG|nr:signal peptide peptidase-domain-containing protein [Phascolomyces articulosus]
MSSSEQQQEIGLYIAYGALMTMAFVPIYTGSIASLSGMKRPTNAAKRKKTDSPLEDSDDEDEGITESLSSSDAWMFPVMGSIVLFSLYMLFRYLDTEILNYLITGYFSLMGCAAVAKTGLMVTKKTMPVSLLKAHVSKYRLTLSRQGKRLSHVSFTVVHFMLLGASVLLTVYYSMTKNWIASNIFGFSFSINAIQLLSLDSFKTGMILLSGLFFYDIFWVFGTEVMVSVAKNFDAPIKVIWPRDIIGYILDGAKSEYGFTMLGLGDIVIPGIFVALCLRFDRHMSWEREPKGEFRSTKFSKPYFTACGIAYILGLATTMAVMHVFHAAQPALLYLSPACIISVLITAAVRGELKDLFAYTTEEEEDKEEKETKKDVKKSKKEDSEKETKESESIAETEEAKQQPEEEGDDEGEEEEDYVAVDKSESPKGGKKKKGGKGGRKKK